MSDEEQKKMLQSLRNSLALLRGTAFLKKIDSELDKTTEQDADSRVKFLTELFIRANAELFQDWRNQSFSDYRPGIINDSLKRVELRRAVTEILCNSETGLFDSNGYVISREEDIHKVFAKFYHKVLEIAPFPYGTQITLDFFMAAFTRLPAFRAVYGGSIDFRRLDDDSKKALKNGIDIEKLEAAFYQALNAKTPRLDNRETDFKKWNNSAIQIKGVQFLSSTNPEGVQYLVTIDGGLVKTEDVESELELWLESNQQIADFPAIPKEKIVGYLPDTEKVRNGDNYSIDGIEIKNGNAPLFCLDTNILTGLYRTRHNELERSIKRVLGSQDATIFDLANNNHLYERLLNYAKNETASDDLVRSIEIAYKRLSAITKLMDKILEEKVFSGVTPVENPELFECMGGAGSGKTLIEKIAHELTNGNFVTASLDAFRFFSDHHHVQVAADHHDGDYRYVEAFANALRTWAVIKARGSGVYGAPKYNLLLDGTGIEFSPRYEDIAKSFKDSGYKTNVVMVDIPLQNAIDRVNSRANGREKRALPWAVVVGKHVKAATSFLDAVNSSVVDKISFFVNERNIGEHYLVAESFKVDSTDIAGIQEAQRDGNLRNVFINLINESSDSVLRADAKASAVAVSQKIASMPRFNEDNVAYVSYPSRDGYKILAIYDVERFIDLVHKGLKNPNASTLEGLNSPPESAAFVVR